MDARRAIEQQVFMAARDQGVNNVLFRNAVGRKLNLNVADNECLSFLTIKGTATPTEVAHYTGLTTGSTTAMLDRLEKAGYITRKPNPNDRRGVLVETSQKWRDTAAPLVVDIQKATRALIARYSDEELKVIADFLARFADNTQAHVNQIERNL